MSGQQAWLSWSSGKDSAWALHEVRRSGSVEIAALFTTITEPFDRVAMHGVRVSLLEAQADAIGLPLVKIPIPFPCSNEQYETAMKAVVERALSEGISTMIFGDLFLEDIRRYREERLHPFGMKALFPLWGMETRQLAEHMIDSGLQAVVTCLDPRVMPRELAGRSFDRSFLASLPAGADPCAERGEFHTMAFAGPMFPRPIPIKVGETVERDGFVFTDVMLKTWAA